MINDYTAYTFTHIIYDDLNLTEIRTFAAQLVSVLALSFFNTFSEQLLRNVHQYILF